jgi:hypothetical protein
MALLAELVWHSWNPDDSWNPEIGTERLRESDSFSLCQYTVKGIPPITETTTVYFITKVEGGKSFATSGIQEQSTALMLWQLLVDDMVIE